MNVLEGQLWVVYKLVTKENDAGWCLDFSIPRFQWLGTHVDKPVHVLCAITAHATWGVLYCLEICTDFINSVAVLLNFHVFYIWSHLWIKYIAIKLST